MQEPFDIVIRDGHVLDGLGSPPIRADLAIRQGRLMLLPAESDTPGKATQFIDAAGCYVVPGFIDIHGHSDYSSLVGPNCASRLAAGITTEVNGNCGYGAFPLDGEVLRRRQDEYASTGLALTWRDVESYFQAAEQIGCAINRVTLIGHGNVRGCVVGYGQQKASAGQLRQMCQIVDRCMSAGCAGLSSGLAYPPGLWADADELTELAGVVARHGGLYASHIRSEGNELLESVEEFLQIVRRSGVRGQLSHVKTAGRANWHKIEPLKRMLADARDQGLDVWADRYPYTASATDLGTIVLPSSAMAGSIDDLLARLADRASRDGIINTIRNQQGPHLDAWLGNVVVTTVAEPALRGCVSKNLRQLPELLGVSDPLEAAIKLIHDDRARPQAVHFSMSDANLREIYSWPFVAVGSDSSSRDRFGEDPADKPHPRAYGTPAEFVDLVVRKWKLMDWPAAVRRMTSLPAEILRLPDRGVIRDGAWADVVVLDPQQFLAQATYDTPWQGCLGIRSTLVNGRLAWQAGQSTGALPGRIIRSNH